MILTGLLLKPNKGLSLERFIEPPQEVIEIAEKEGFEDFPKAVDILTIARIESSFNPKAKNGKSNGIMQVNHGSFKTETNMKSGILMLRELYEKLGSSRSAIIAYNIGIGNFLKKKSMISGQKYFDKFSKHRSSYESFYSKQQSSSNTYLDSLSVFGPFNMAEFFSSGSVLQHEDQTAGKDD